jgi:hypothetical protein
MSQNQNVYTSVDLRRTNRNNVYRSSPISTKHLHFCAHHAKSAALPKRKASDAV